MAAVTARVVSAPTTSAVACSSRSTASVHDAVAFSAAPSVAVGNKAAFFGNATALSRRSTMTAQARTGIVCAAAGLEEVVAGIEALGPDIMNDTYYPKGGDQPNVTKPWVIVDAKDQTLGRLACLVANKLRGKDKAEYHPSMDTGSYVVVINAEQVKVTGNKASQKLYRRHTTGLPGAMKVETFTQLQARIPERIIEKAVKGMLPKGALGRKLFTHMKVYAGESHPHEAQQPEDITGQINKKPSKTSN